MELDDHQMPLFEWHPLSEEFDRRLRTVSAWMERFWPKFKNQPRELGQQIFSAIEMYPLELLMERSVVEVVPDGYCEGSPSFRRDQYIPYLGDHILWNLSPLGLLNLPEGEVFRRRLILVIRCEEKLLDRRAQQVLARIDEVLQAQAREISAFHSTLAARIDELLYVARRDGMHALPI
jgi:PAS domain-containing protein